MKEDGLDQRHHVPAGDVPRAHDGHVDGLREEEEEEEKRGERENETLFCFFMASQGRAP